MPDLAFRLTAVRFAVPPLRERREDIAPLAQALAGPHLRALSAAAGFIWDQAPWRVCCSTIGRATFASWPACWKRRLLDAENGIIRPEDLSLSLDSSPSWHAARRRPTSKSLSLDAVIHRHVQYVLDFNHGNKLRTARQLGISRSTLYRILGNEAVLAR